MTIKDLLKIMLREFFIIITGIVFCTAVFCSLFYPKVVFGLEMFWQIILLGGLTTLPQIVFYSKKELSKNQMLVRQIVHILILLLIILFGGYGWGWIAPNNIIQPLVFLTLVLCVYVVVSVLVFQRDKKLAEKINNGLKKYNEKQY